MVLEGSDTAPSTVKTVVSVSLGSARGDFDIQTTLGGTSFRIRRLGAGGDLRRARSLVEQFDGNVDAIGLGGANLAYRLGTRLYPCREGLFVARGARVTPVVDGSGFKDTYEREVPAYLERNGICVAGEDVLLASALDRWGLGEALEEAGARVLVGDALFALGIPVVFPGLRWFEAAARLSMWGLSHLPLRWLYPLGAEQETGAPRPAPAWPRASIVAGDFHLVKRHMPRSLDGRTIVTTSTRPEDRGLLKERGTRAICTMVPPLEGRTFGANVLDALAVAAKGKFPLDREDYMMWWEQVGLTPHVEWYK